MLEPTYTNAGDGRPADRTAAQSELVVLGEHRFLMLARDRVCRGLTASPSKTPMVKSLLIVDTIGATNLAGTRYETGIEPVACKRQVIAGITPARSA